jgi:hypothetical protein
VYNYDPNKTRKPLSISAKKTTDDEEKNLTKIFLFSIAAKDEPNFIQQYEEIFTYLGNKDGLENLGLFNCHHDPSQWLIFVIFESEKSFEKLVFKDINFQSLLSFIAYWNPDLYSEYSKKKRVLKLSGGILEISAFIIGFIIFILVYILK